MVSRLIYGIQEGGIGSGRLCVDIPENVWDRVAAHPALGVAVRKLRSKRFGVFEVKRLDEGGMRIALNDRQIGASGNIKPVLAFGAVSVLAGVEMAANKKYADHRLHAKLSIKESENGQHEPKIKVMIPKQFQDKTLISAASGQMQNIAANLRFVDEKILPELVYADIERGRGMELHVNTLGRKGSMATNPAEYSPKADYTIFEAHDLYNYEQQLICLVGAVALTRPGKLALA